MSDTNAKNVGTVVNDPKSLNITNVFNDQTPKTLPSNIPTPKGFIPRENQLEALRKARQNGKTSFVLHGIGGAGKTEIALKFIEEIKDLANAHIRINMRGSSGYLSPDNAMLKVIRAFEPNLPADLSPSKINERYVSLLNEHKTVLFLDNAENRDQVESMNQGMAFIVITSRTTFNVTGGFSLEVAQMSPKEALNLLYSIADENRFHGKADSLARLAGYLPMALSPLASILADDKTEDVESLIERYSERKERLRLADQNRKNLSVEASFDLSYDCLSEELKDYWRKLAIFPSDFELTALKILWQDQNPKDKLSALVKNNLVIYDTDNKRSHLHDLARDYLYEKLFEEEHRLIGKLHTTHYGKFLSGLDQVNIDNIRAFDLERTNIEAGYNWIKNNSNIGEPIIDIVESYTCKVSVIPILLLRFEPNVFLTRMEIGYTASKKAGRRECENRSLGRMGIAYKDMKSTTVALAFHLQALSISREINDRFGESLHLGNCGVCYRRMKDLRKAVSFHEEAYKVAKDINDRSLEMLWASNLGINYCALKDIKKAVDYLEYALLLSVEINDILGRGYIMHNLGDCYRKLGDFSKSIALSAESLEISLETVDERGEIKRLNNLGRSYRNIGDKENARLHFEKALQKLDNKGLSHAKMVRDWLTEMEAE